MCRVDEVLPSYYWPQNAIVIVLECQHRHVRPSGWEITEAFNCCFCGDDKPTGDVLPNREQESE